MIPINEISDPPRRRLLYAAVSAALLVFSFPGIDLEFLAWIAFVPLFFALKNRKPAEAFLLSYFTGVLFFLGTIYWLMHVTLAGMIALSLYLGLYFGLFGLLFSVASRVSLVGRKELIANLFLIPAAWVVSEWLRSNLMSGFGWVALGYSQSFTLPVIQIADITGVYGVGFLIVLVNAAIFFAIRDMKRNVRFETPLLIAAFLIFVSLSYGFFRMNNIFTGEILRVGVVQGNIAQDKKWDASFREEILSKYENLTRELVKERPDLIIWPETSAPGYLENTSDKPIFDRVRALATAGKIPLLVGTPREDRIDKNAYYNSAVFYSGDGSITDTYDKVHLVPFGEYVPLKKIFSFVNNFAPSPIGDFTAGKDYTVFNFFLERKADSKDYSWKMVKKVKFSCLICFEDVFPQVSRMFVKKGAAFLVNITNDAWYKRTSAPYQHAQCSIFRAVENRVNVIRAANTGLSCFIDQKGRVLAAVGVNGDNLFVDGVRSEDITISNTRTFYNVYGDLFSYICIIFVSFYMCVIAIRNKKIG
ncbi:MAG: apolipoprotein N-acyltransferase [Candidatus Omnitrophota bacterium]|jgi:apolipoprotein N-acyltransferase